MKKVTDDVRHQNLRPKDKEDLPEMLKDGRPDEDGSRHDMRL